MKYLRKSIILRIFYVMIALLWSIPVHVSADSFPGCLSSNPCDCECSDYSEWWPSTKKIFHGKTIDKAENTGPSNCVCPPYNKHDGRTNCLKNPNGVGFPGMFSVGYMNICAEQSPESDYFSPAIRYRAQTCNVACWTLKGDLTGDGKCTVIPSAKGIPLIRLCARMAVPEVPATGTSGDIDYVEAKPADPGYTQDVHLDFEGYLVDDNPLSNGGYDVHGKPISVSDPNLQAPKICLYWDPSLVDTLLANMVLGSYIGMMHPILEGLSKDSSGMNADPMTSILEMIAPDFMDYNPLKQSNHKTDKLNPIFQLLIDMAGATATLQNGIASMIDKLPDYIKYSMMPLSVIEYTLKLGAWIIDHGMVPVLKFIGTMNRVVVGSFGCVDVPLGPFPPPYCQPLAQTMSVPTTYEICSTSVMNNGINLLLQQSTTADPCDADDASCNAKCWTQCDANKTCDTCTPPVQYGLCVKPLSVASRNNVINNSIRVGFNDYKRLCTTSDTSSGRCVTIHGSLDASTYSKVNTLPLCSTTTPVIEAPACIISEFLSSKCNAATTKPWYCAPGARIRVAYTMSGGRDATDYYDASIPSCTSGLGTNGPCQSIFGINLGEYADLVVKFPEHEPSSDAYDIQPDATLNSGTLPPPYRVSDTVTLHDSSNGAHQFQAIITREDTQISPSGISSQEPQKICAYEITTDVLGASGRAAIGCNDRATFPKPQVSDNGSTFFLPAMRVSIRVPINEELTPPFDGTEGDIMMDASGFSNAINLAGHNYSAYATDSTFIKPPFSGSHAILNSKSRYGNYIDDVAPYDAGWNANDQAIYLNGVEYLNGAYKVGAQQFCLTGYAFDDCFSGKTRQNCVLAQLFNSDVISCDTFKAVQTKYPGIEVCNPDNTGPLCDDINNIRACATGVACDFSKIEASYQGGNNNGNTVNIIPCTSTFVVNGGAKSVMNKYCYNYTVQGAAVVPNTPLCQVSYDGKGRLVPPTNTNSALLNTYRPNIDYYNYTPGIFAQATQTTSAPTIPDVVANSSVYNSVISTARSAYAAPITTTYSPATCTSNALLLQTDPTLYNNMIAACTIAQNISSQIDSICSEAQKLIITPNTNLTSACNAAQSSIKSILADQSTTESVVQMQKDATSAQAVMTTMMSAINAVGNQRVSDKARSIQAAPIATTYSPSTCTSTSTPYNNMMQACITARSTSDKINSICTNTQKLVTDTRSTLYQQLKSACDTAKSAIQTLLAHQFAVQTIMDMQIDASDAQPVLANLMNIINNFAGNPNVVQNIMNTEKKIYNSTDTTIYPVVNNDSGATAKIEAICTQTQAVITSPAAYPTLSAALKSACTAAHAKGVAPATALNTLHGAIAGFTQYDLSNNGHTQSSSDFVSSQSSNILTSGYTPPDFSSMVVRNRTDVENGLCIPVPQPTCAATTDKDAVNNGNAIWPLAVIGGQVSGTCNNGYNTADNSVPTRYCGFDKGTKTAMFTSVSNVCIKQQLCSIKKSIPITIDNKNVALRDPVGNYFQTRWYLNNKTETDYVRYRSRVVSGYRGEHTYIMKITPTASQPYITASLETGPNISIKMQAYVNNHLVMDTTFTGPASPKIDLGMLLSGDKSSYLNAGVENEIKIVYTQNTPEALIIDVYIECPDS